MGTNSTSPPAKFTATRLATLPPAGSPYKDPAQESLYFQVRARKSGTCSRTWLHRIKFKGKDTYLTLGHFPATGLQDARQAVQEQREMLSKGIDPRRAAPRRKPATATSPSVSNHSIEFLAGEFYERHVLPRRKKPEYAKRIIDREILPVWAGRDARTIKPREIIDLLDALVDRDAPVMANRVAGILGQMFKFGVHRATIETSPVQLLYRPGGKESPRARSLSDDELKALIADPRAATRFERLSHVILILLLTGQRRGELALARWIDVNFEARTWAIPDAHAKGGKGHTVPLSDAALAEFEALRRLAKHDRFVLPNEDGDGPADPKLLTRGVARCLPRMRKLGIEAFTLHDLRRTCRTGLARLKGADGKPAVLPHIAERVLNHAQEKIEGTYDQHDYLDEKRAALNLWAAHLASLVAQGGT